MFNSPVHNFERSHWIKKAKYPHEQEEMDMSIPFNDRFGIGKDPIKNLELNYNWASSVINAEGFKNKSERVLELSDSGLKVTFTDSEGSYYVDFASEEAASMLGGLFTYISYYSH